MLPGTLIQLEDVVKRTRSRLSLLAALAMMFSLVPLTAASAAPATGVFLSELHYDNASTDVGEFFEVTGDKGGDLVGWSVVLYNGNGGASYATINLTGTIPDEDGSQGAVAFLHGGIQNGAPDGLALVDDGGVVVEFLSYEGSFAAVDGPADGMTSTDIGVAETSSTAIGESLQVLSGVWTGPAAASPGLLNTAPPPPPTATEEKIYDVQGSGSDSPFEGQQVIVEGVVTADHQDGEFNGFFMQEVVGDGIAETSDGIFVYEGGNTVEVNVGDVVKVEGTVAEFFGDTQITDVVDVAVTGTAAFAATVVTLPWLDFDQPEQYEGMYVTIPQPLTISEYFNYDRFGEIVLTTGRHATPTAVFDPGSTEQADLAEANALGRITLDDNRTSQNPDPAIHPNGAVFDLNNLFRGGDLVENVTGVVNYSFGKYRIQPTQGADYTAVNSRPASPDDVGGSLTVASFNVLNYFTTIDTGADICGPAEDQGCRGADDAEEFERQRAKIVSAIAEINADIVGLIEIENFADGGVDEPLSDLVSGINDVLGAGTYAAVETGAVGDDVIKVAFIYKPASVSLNGAYAVLDSSVDPTFNDDKNRAVLAQTFTQLSNGEGVTVAVNHLKSKGSNCDSLGDPDLGDGAGNCNLTRTSAATALVNWLAADATGSGEDDVLIIGDLNSYDKEDPIDAIIAGGYADLVADFGGELAYSYVFSGQWGYLDYAMANTALQSAVTGTTVWHINADEPDILDYNTDFAEPAQQALYEPNAYRASDHDPVIVGLELDRTPPVVTAELIPDHGNFYTVSFSCVDAGDPDPTCVGDINGIPVEDGQTVALIWNRGKVKSWYEEGILFIKDSAFVLTVVGTDNVGNTATAVTSLRDSLIP
ncbi:MAG: ExeM/NucH family extracellular endonuclease [Actinomycetota bacterium]